MVNSSLELGYQLFFGESDSRDKGLLSNGKKYSVDGLNINRVIEFLRDNNFRVLLDSSKKDSEIWQKNGLEQTLIGVPIQSKFGEFQREEVRKYFLPAINNGKYADFDETKYNHANLTITDTEYTKVTNGQRNKLVWRLDFADNIPLMEDAERMVHEFEEVAYAVHGMRDVLERIRSNRATVRR